MSNGHAVLLRPDAGEADALSPARQARLGGSPMELIERSQTERVLRLLIRLEEGTHV